MSKSLDKKVADERKRIQAKILKLVKEDEELAAWEESRKEKPETVTINPANIKGALNAPTFKDMMASAIDAAGEKP